MAQALFDEHPLEEYLRESGESPTVMPGISSELEQELDPHYGLFDDMEPEDLPADWCPPILLEFLELLQSVAALFKSQNSSSSFVERFKYNVISSSLLELTLPTLRSERIYRRISIPGNLGHSRASSMELDRPVSPTSASLSSEPSYSPISLAALLTAIFLSTGYPSLAFISMIAALFLLYIVISTTDTSKHDMTSSLNALDDLVAANDLWDSVVQDAMTFLDNEDNNRIHSSTGASSPSPIRVALHSCLQMTHTQCDNIRHLFSALTSPTHLSQLSEMYAPPSPANSVFETSPRRLSVSSPRLPYQPASLPTTPQNKRSTWNGSYSSIAFSGSPTMSIYRRRKRRQANLSDVFQASVSSAPSSPFVNTTARIEELNDAVLDEFDSGATDQFPSLPSQFGAAALDLQRKRRSGGMEAFRTPPVNYFSADLRSPPSSRSSMFASASKFTNVQPSRHPLSHSSLNHALQGALAAKRYACSHMLALRFSDEEDEGYWEDVRSVMTLLSSALIDSFSGLGEALIEAEQQTMRDSNPTPVMDQFQASSNDSDAAVHMGQDAGQDSTTKWQKSSSRVSFAPMPNNISRFAAHIAAISSALEDAKEHLDQCVSSLKADPSSPSNSSPSKRLRHSRSASKMSVTPDSEESEALQAYERLRRELGLALRECERGRGRLLEIINPPMAPSDDEEEFDDLPGLANDASDDSDKADPSPFDDEAGAAALAAACCYRPAVVGTEGAEGEGATLDDATSHLLLTTSTQHLPLPGIEEVFEADTGAKTTFSRERSRLSREERIKITKARRESGMGLSIGLGTTAGLGDEVAANGLGGVEKWGPGGEVVQELKDVIWKVGERRRRMIQTAAPPPISQVDAPSASEVPSELTQLADTLESL
ncbi:hypothetical protein BDN70DRAFT_878612 [Pholiota conissans]|uniref:Myosin-binding domain-containing protein n=1 Tax=Pholiota conissans TaxID=109636 RepID=A0A9P5Z198_9AGAR|nr:hypothetical protein BDN70DRAFT_878612 [Pholiota conissans]